jgi:Pregnancy-associated plasma protein-A
MARKSTKRSKSSKKAAVNPRVPTRRLCGTMQAHFRLLEQDPNFRVRQAALERTTIRRMEALGAAAAKAATTVIPVVVHVVYNTAAENVTMPQIKSQISVLNRDFRAKNPDKSKVPLVFKGLVADANIQFALAEKDPKGKPTNGVTRTKTTRTSFRTDDSVKFAESGGHDAWPTDRYLNIWVCSLDGGILGYAQFPGGPPKTDGVVILNRAFGTNGSSAAPFNLGRTATHEVGHWLNLRHIWGDTEDCSGSDLVSDTPNAAGPNFGIPSFPHVSCHNGPNGDMFMNYMDYVHDAAMFMFTAQQVERMRTALDTERNAF